LDDKWYLNPVALYELHNRTTMGEEESQLVNIFIISAAFVVLLAVLLVLFLIIYQKRIIAQENRLQKLENERQKVLLKATIEGQERERERLAKDLHDGIGSLLSGLSMNMKFQRGKEDPDSEQGHFLTEACDMLDEGIQNVRAVSHNLMPATLEKLGLVTAMKETIGRINQTDEFKIKLSAPKASFSLPKSVSLGLLRIFQELLQNTIKHAGASLIKITVEYHHDDHIRLHYTDNGKGIEKTAIKSGGIGMKNMESRVQALEGTFQLNRTNPNGFEAEIEVPLESKESEI
jgi:signal transduction histidine kinase